MRSRMLAVPSHDAVERVETTMSIIAGKWKPAIMFALVTYGTLRFTQLRKMIPKVSQRMLTQQLRDLERYGLLQRRLYPEIPPRVEYSVTPLGKSLDPIFKSVCDWATRNFPQMEDAQLRYRRIARSRPSSAKGWSRM